MTHAGKRGGWLAGAGLWLALTAGAGAVEVQFQRDWSSAVEDAGTVPVVLTLSAPASNAVRVAVAVRGGTANADDYTLTVALVEFPPGAVTASASLAIANDGDAEGSETVALGLTGLSGATVGARGTHTVTILDNDSAPSVQVGSISCGRSDLQVSEGIGTVVVPVRLSAAGVGTATVAYRTVARSASSGEDYTETSGTLQFRAGVTEQRISVPVIDDRRAEELEDFRVELFSVSGALEGAGMQCRCSIVDNDAVRADFAVATNTVSEKDSGFGVDVVLSVPADFDVAVTYTLAGDAGPEVDYTTSNRRELDYAPGVQTQRVAFGMIDDETPEASEAVVVLLEDVTRGTAGEASMHAVTILDDDLEVPSVAFLLAPTGTSERAVGWVSTMSVAVEEGQGAGAFTLRLSNTSAQPITVAFALEAKTAARDADFVLADEALTVTFPPGTREQLLAFEVLDDTEAESDESFSVWMTNAVHARLNREVLTCWIRDDDRMRVVNEYLYETRTPSVEPGRELVVVGSKDPTIRLRGLARDMHGNRYFTDQGPNGAPGEGALVMWPAGVDHIVRLERGLTQPEDVELAPDGRSLLYVTADGNLHRHVCGALIKLTGKTYANDGRAIVYAMTDVGAVAARYLAEGYYYVPDLLSDAQTHDAMDVTIEYRGVTKTIDQVPLRYPGEVGEWQGERWLELEF